MRPEDGLGRLDAWYPPPAGNSATAMTHTCRAGTPRRIVIAALLGWVLVIVGAGWMVWQAV